MNVPSDADVSLDNAAERKFSNFPSFERCVLLSRRSAMSGRQYNMYNVQNAESWKQRVCKENLHNAPTFSALAGSTTDDDAVSVSSVGSGVTGISGGSQASIASTAALKRVCARCADLHTCMASRPARPSRTQTEAADPRCDRSSACAD